jgi:hypothetical protein
MSLGRAIKWGSDALPMSTYCSNVVMTGTGAPDHAPFFLKRCLIHHWYTTPVESGVSWVYEVQNKIPALCQTAPHILLWQRWECEASDPWRVVLHEMYGAGTSSVPCTTVESTPAAGQIRADRLAQIQSAFGFSLQDLARVLGISRAQLYKWLDSDREIQLQEESRSRLSQILELASEWRQLSPLGLNAFAHEPVPGASDIVALMSQPDLNMSDLRLGLHHLAARTSPRTGTEQLRERGFRRRPSASSLPSDA